MPDEYTQFEFEGALRQCPQCGASGNAIIPVLVHHFLIQDRKGLIAGQFGIRHSVACSPAITAVKLGNAVQMSTIEPMHVNCARCLATKEWRDAVFPLYEKFAAGLVDSNQIPRFTPEAQAVMEGLGWRLILS
jgi:hypothetical protein